jgi:uncharacterized protein (TIGR02453 family)
VAFKGWPAEALEFYEGLEADNSKGYWTEHRAVYERAVYGPMAALLSDLTDEFGAGRIFRPYRDIRFSADKTPYKTNIAAAVGPSGYVHLSADGLMAGAGMYHLAPDQLERYRLAVAAERTGAELESLIASLRRAQVDVYGSDALRSVPRGYPKDHPRAGLLRNKGLVATKRWPVAAWLGTTGAKTRVADLLRATGPLCGWLDEHVGPSTLPPARGR